MLGRAAMAVVGLLLIAPAAGAKVTGTVTADYSGTMDSTFVYDPSNPAIDQSVVHVMWEEKVTIRATSQGPPVVVGKPVITIDGKVTSTYAPPNTSHSCTGDLSPRPDLYKRFAEGIAPLTMSISGGRDGDEVEAGAIMPITGTYMKSTAPDDTDCGVSSNGAVKFKYFPDESHEPLGGTLTPLKNSSLNDLPFEHHFKEDYKDPYSDTETNINATFSISASDKGHKPPSDTPGRFRAKRNALNGMRDTFGRMLYPCLATAGAAPLLGLGPLGQAAGAVIVSVGGVLCIAYTKTINDEANTFADPPIGSYHRVARVPTPKKPNLKLPDCSKFDASARPFCQQLEAAMTKLVSAVAGTQAVAATIATTIGRETAAMRHHDKTAVKRQDNALKRMAGTFSKAERTETTVGSAVAQLMHTANLPAALDTDQSDQAIIKVSKALAKQGIGHKRLASALGPLLKPAPVDWLARLAAPPG